jgi:type IV fimbrial biogenesis protein FimT
MAWTNSRQSTGFTLIELILVTAVLALLTIIATPSIKGLIVTIRVNAAIRDLASDMQWARMKAVAENNDYWITFNAADNSYSIYDDNDNDGPEADELVKTISIPANHNGIEYGYITGTKGPNGNTITDEIGFPSDKLRFYSRGTTNSEGYLYLIPTEDLSTNNHNRMRALNVVQTGRIRVYRYDANSNPPWK